MITATYLIGKHLLLTDGPVMDEPCILCGFEPDGVRTGLKRRDVVSDTFIDCDYLRPGNTVCVYCAACLGYGHARTEFVKNWSVLATETSLIVLKREDIWDRLMNPPKDGPFVFCVTQAHKKHMSFKARVNAPVQPFWVRTENTSILVDPGGMAGLADVMQRWYTVCQDTSSEPTWFAKQDIIHGCSNYKRIEAYGIDRYLAEDEMIRPYRRTGLLELLCYALNKARGNGA